MYEDGAQKRRYHAFFTRFGTFRTPKITGRLSSTPELWYRTYPYRLIIRHTCTSRARRSRAPHRALRRPHDHWWPCAAQRVGIDSRRDHDQSRRTTRQRSWGAFKQHTISAYERGARVRAAAAHRVVRRCPATAGPPSEALKDRRPAKQRGVRRWGCTYLRPDTPAGQNLSDVTNGNGNVARLEARGWEFRVRGSYLHQHQPTAPQRGARSTCRWWPRSTALLQLKGACPGRCASPDLGARSSDCGPGMPGAHPWRAPKERAQLGPGMR